MPTRQRAGRSEGQRSWTRRPNPLAPTNIAPARPAPAGTGAFPGTCAAETARLQTPQALPPPPGRAVADNLISVEVRVYEARTMSLIDTISARSGDINTSKKLGAEDAAGILGALTQPRSTGNGSDNAAQTEADVEKIEQRLEPLVTEIAGQIAARYGAGQMQDMSGTASPRGLASGGQQQPASSPKSQKGTRR